MTKKSFSLKDYSMILSIKYSFQPVIPLKPYYSRLKTVTTTIQQNGRMRLPAAERSLKMLTNFGLVKGMTKSHGIFNEKSKSL